SAILSPGLTPRETSRFATWLATESTNAYDSRMSPKTTASRSGASRAASSRRMERLSMVLLAKWRAMCVGSHGECAEHPDLPTGTDATCTWLPIGDPSHIVARPCARGLLTPAWTRRRHNRGRIEDGR